METGIRNCEVKDHIDVWPYRLSCMGRPEFQVSVNSPDHPLLKGWPYSKPWNEPLLVCQMHFEMAQDQFSELFIPHEHVIEIDDEVGNEDRAS